MLKNTVITNRFQPENSNLFNINKRNNIEQYSVLTFVGRLLNPLLDDKKVLNTFKDEIATIPRATGNCQQISDYLSKELKKEGFIVHQQQQGYGKGNIIATRNPSNKDDAIILQAHMDMVYATKTSKKRPGAKPPVVPIIQGDYLMAKNTSLGADDGIGVAIALEAARIKDPAFRNIPLQIIFTVDEENGLVGIKDIDTSKINGKYLINLDNGKIDSIIVGSAGIIDFNVKEKVPVCNLADLSDKPHKTLSIDISRATGGHSGLDMNKGRFHPAKFLLDKLAVFSSDIKILSFNAGENICTIPTDARVELLVPADKFDSIVQSLTKSIETTRSKHNKTDPNLRIEITDGGIESNDITVLDPKFQQNLFKVFKDILPSEIIDIKDNANKPTTSQNLGFIKLEDGELNINFRLRSNKKSNFEAILNNIQKNISVLVGRPVYPDNVIKPWQPTNGKLTEVAVKAFEKINDRPPRLSNPHATVEGAFFDTIIKEIVCIGPTVKAIHTPNERILIKTLEPICNILETIIKNLHARFISKEKAA